MFEVDGSCSYSYSLVLIKYCHDIPKIFLGQQLSWSHFPSIFLKGALAESLAGRSCVGTLGTLAIGRVLSDGSSHGIMDAIVHYPLVN